MRYSIGFVEQMNPLLFRGQWLRIKPDMNQGKVLN